MFVKGSSILWKLICGVSRQWGNVMVMCDDGRRLIQTMGKGDVDG